MKRGLAAVIIFTIVLASLIPVFASFDYKSNTLATQYSAGEKIRGKINISLDDELAGSIVRSNFNGSIKLIELLKKSGFVEGVNYNCNYKNCIDGYKTAGSAGTFSLSGSSQEFVGFQIIGEDINVRSLKFEVVSTAAASCSRQIRIDVLDKNESFVQNNKHSGSSCGEEFSGCFNSGLGNYQKVVLGSNPYCENITLGTAPAYKLGATIDNGTLSATLTMKLYSDDWDFLGECNLPKHSETSEKLGCNVNRSIGESGNFFVCIMASVDNSGYKIKAEEQAPNCGTYTNGPPYTTDYDLFAAPISFDAVGTIIFNESLYSSINPGNDLISDVNDYLNSNYGGNCSAGCPIPFRIDGISQSLTFSNAQIDFEKRGGLFSESAFYKFEKDGSKIKSAGSLALDVGEANFIIPIGSTAKTFQIFIADKSVLPKALDISISPSFSFDISPKTALVGPRTDFLISTTSKINSSTWDFGDGTIRTSPGKTISHRYSDLSAGKFRVNVEVVRDDGVKAKNSFDIAIGPLSESAKALADEYFYNIKNITSDIASFAPFISNSIKSKLNITSMEAVVIKQRNELAKNPGDEQYKQIINNLLAANIPSSIDITEEGKSLPLLFGFSNINVDHISSISEKEITSEEEKQILARAITSWTEKNYGGTIDYEIIKADYADKQEPLVTHIKLDLRKKQEADESADSAYLIIDYPKENLLFREDYGGEAVNAGTFIPIGDSKVIEILVDGELKINEFGFYLSPKIDMLEGYLALEEVEKQGFRWGRFFIWMIVLLIISLGIYIALQEWYKRKYESYLFKNPDDLYNVINFVYNSRKRGLDDSEINRKLKEARWNGEQISYAFKKLDGKRTGMWEIPLFRFWEKKKVMEEIEKRKKPSPLVAVVGAKQTYPLAQAAKEVKPEEKKGFMQKVGGIFKKKEKPKNPLVEL